MSRTYPLSYCISRVPPSAGRLMISFFFFFFSLFFSPPPFSLPLFLSLSLALSFVLLLGGRSSTFSRSNPRKTFPAGSHRANPASPLHPLSFVRPPRPESRSYLTYTRVYLRVDLSIIVITTVKLALPHESRTRTAIFILRDPPPPTPPPTLGKYNFGNSVASLAPTRK